jgi:hypothetical protein
LPVEAQLKFLKQPLLSGPDCTALALRSDSGQSNLFASLPEVPEPERLNFSARQNVQALKRLEAIAPLVEFASRSRRSRPTFRTVAGVAVRSMNSLASYLADQHHLSPRTLWNWYAQTVAAENPKADLEIPYHGPTQWWPAQLCIGPAAVLGDSRVASRRRRSGRWHVPIVSELPTIHSQSVIGLPEVLFS